LFRMVKADQEIGCTSETCNHVSHDMAASVNALIPLKGKLCLLGFDGNVGYYMLKIESPLAYAFIALTEPQSYWATAKVVEIDSVPDWMLIMLAQAKRAN